MRLTALILLLALPSLATTIHVPADQQTIQAGIDAASIGDTVRVACGTYYETYIDLRPGIYLVSESGEADCVTLDAQNQPGSKLLICSSLTPPPTIEGFTITGALGANGQSEGAGLACGNTSLIIRNCDFIANSAWNRGGGASFGAYAPIAYPIIENCRFIGNAAEEGGGLYIEGGIEPTILNCTFSANTADYDGAAIRIENCGTALLIDGCTFEGNNSELGAGISFHQVGNPFIANCTFYKNTATTGTGIHAGSNSHPVVDNCIVSFGLQGVGAIGTYGGTLDFTCTDIFGNEGGDWVGEIASQLGVSGNIAADPFFCDPDLDDFTLRNDSPCAPENSDCGVLMGAWPVGCSTSTSDLTWSAIKTLY